MAMNLRQIEVFRAVMLTGSISGAAELLHVSQPAISRLMSYTESRMKLVLFERIKGRLFATPEAHRLFAEVESVYRGVQRINEVAQDLVEQRTGTLRVAASPALSQTVIPLAIAAFRRAYPDVRFHLQTLVSTQLVQAVLTQQVELALAIVPVDHPNLKVSTIHRNPMLAILPAEHPLAARRQLRIADLQGCDFIGYHADTPLGQTLGKLFESAAVTPNVVAEVRLTHIACALAQAGAGVALVDESAVRGQSWRNVVLRPLRPAVSMPVSVAHLQVLPLSRLAQTFVQLLSRQLLQALPTLPVQPAVD
ncbi:MAG: LysR family transcriptional regulator [Burkholderiales bacterium]|nr:LysR family transcriptional regulator [Burkholderiales bacterium]MDE2456624.1 LysR family transcriptional regulator [Burkholderiales bacterium]